eukprot:jgi/Undpi1/13520/HiC_scaffold_8.g03179.m1
MKLLRLVCYGAVALWGITRDASSCSNDERVGRQTELDVGELDTEAVGDGDVQIVNSTADDDETNAGGTAPMNVSKGHVTYDFDAGEGGQIGLPQTCASDVDSGDIASFCADEATVTYDFDADDRGHIGFQQTYAADVDNGDIASFCADEVGRSARV